jgi:hypothetical protein
MDNYPYRDVEQEEISGAKPSTPKSQIQPHLSFATTTSLTCDLISRKLSPGYFISNLKYDRSQLELSWMLIHQQFQHIKEGYQC